MKKVDHSNIINSILGIMQAKEIKEVLDVLYVQGIYLNNIYQRYLKSDGDYYISRDELKNYGLTIADIKNSFHFRIINRQKHYDYSKDIWVGEYGYWLCK